VLQANNGDVFSFEQIDFYGRYRRSNIQIVVPDGRRIEVSSIVDCTGRRVSFSDQKNIWIDVVAGTVNSMYLMTVCR
jgi:hypothetical protein